jgi:thiamine-phosphate pyrophosphorylase
VTTRPLLCLVTDRLRLARALGRSDVEWRRLLLAQIEGAVAGGIDLVQVREPDLEARDLANVVRAAVAIAEGSPARVLVNDRIDVALIAGAHGVHLRDAGVPTRAARRLAPALTIGRSVHSVDDVAAAGPVDYLIAGTVFPTPSKPHIGATLGAQGLAAIRAAAGATPILAIGGVTREQAGNVVQAGASGMAAIGAFVPTDQPADLARAVEQAVQQLRFAFDTAAAVP